MPKSKKGKSKKVVAKKKSKQIKPPIDRIILDGSNITCFAGYPDIAQLSAAYYQIKEKYHFKKIRIIVGPGLRHKVGLDEFDRIKKEFKENETADGERILFESPAYANDDPFIIRYAIDHDFLILSNDCFRDYIEEHPELESEIKRRLVKFMIMDGDLMITKFPDY